MNMQRDNAFARLWGLGFKNLIPIVPPGAELSERSNLFKRLQDGEDARGKSPGVRWRDGRWSGFDWLPYVADEDDLTRWHEMGAGVGIKTGPDGLILIDADTLHEDRAAIIKDAVEKFFGALPVRIGRYPKAGYLARVSEPIQYTRIEFGERDDKGRLRERVEVLSDGRQFVAEGIHASTGKPYRWPTGIPSFDEVPVVDPNSVLAFLEHLRPLLPAASEIVREGAKTDVDQETLKGTLELVSKAVRATPNTSEHFPTRESYRDFGYAIKAALPDHPNEAFALFDEWCGRWSDGINPPAVVEADWSRMKPPFRRGASFIYETAEKLAPESFSRAEQWFVEPQDYTPLFPPESPPSVFGSAEAARIKATAFKWRDPATLPRREWLYGHHFIRKFVSTTIAPSGIGKSSLAIVEALAMATGRDLLGVKPRGRYRVWLWNGEDPQEELERRVLAVMLHYQITPYEVDGWLFVDSGRDTEITLAVETRDGAKILAPVSDAVIRVIEENHIDVMTVDPFISSHRVSENDNGAIDMVSKQWARIADRTGCAIELVHHVRKLNGAEITVEDSRGAVSLIATSRSARALSRMTKPEGLRFGIEHYQRLFRFGDAKNNLAPPATEDTRWFELKGVPLGNGDGAGVDALMSGDSVGVVTLYDGVVQAADTVQDGEKAEALAIIRRACVNRHGAALLSPWRKDPRANDAWVGTAIAAAMKLDASDPGDKARLKTIISDWIKDGSLVEVQRRDEQRKMRVFIEAAAPADEPEPPASVFN